MMFGPDEVTEGYYELEELERNQSLNALLKHREAVFLWYRALTLYRRGMMGTWEYLGDDGLGDNMTAWGLQMQMLGLGVGSAKATLDLLLAGYYSNAFAGIRHMVESVVQSAYLMAFPGESPLWYGKPGRRAREHAATHPNEKLPEEFEYGPPGCTKMVKRFREEFSENPQWVSTLDAMYDSWKLMSKGSHPTTEGMRQTTTDDSSFHVVGSTYVEDLCLVAFDHGLLAIDRQLGALAHLKPQTEEWTAKHAALAQDMRNWRRATKEKLSLTDFSSPEEESV